MHAEFCDGQVQSKINCFLTVTTPECTYLSTNFGVSLNGDGTGWSGDNGSGISASAIYVPDNSPEGGEFLVSFDWAECGWGGQQKSPFGCDSFITGAAFYPLEGPCCPLGTNVGLSFSGGIVLPDGKPPVVIPLCEACPGVWVPCSEIDNENGGSGGEGGGPPPDGPSGCNGFICSPPAMSSAPVRYGTGELSYKATDLIADGYGTIGS